MSPEKARELRDEVRKGHPRCHPETLEKLAPQPGTQKQREIRFVDNDAPGKGQGQGAAEQAARARVLLTGLEELTVAPGKHGAHTLTVCYDVRNYTLQGLEHALIRQGFALESGWYWRLTRAVLYFSEETQLRNMRSPERLLKKSHEVFSRAWDKHPHGDHDETPPELRQEK